MRKLISLWLIVCGVAFAQITPVPPPPTGTPSHPFFVTKTWIVGGVGDWDYMTMDPSARQLLIAHGPAVQVVDVGTGVVAGTITGLREAHAIVLDSEGSYGYISDGPADSIRVFDRRTFQIVASIPTGPAPRSMALDPTSGLLFVVGSQSSPTGAAAAGGVRSGPSARPTPSRQPPAYGGYPTQTPGTASTLTVIDADKRMQLAQIVLAGNLGFAQGDGNGRIYITVADRNQIIRLDAQAIGSAVHRILDRRVPATKNPPVKPSEKALLLDWTPNAKPAPPADAYPYTILLDSNCRQPRALAFDSAHDRLFAACTNMRMVVLNAETGQGIAALPIGPGPDAIAYDANRGLIFSANGGGDGSLTIIRQDVTDTYAVIQTLPTRQHARTLAVNSSSGEVYLTSVIYGAQLNHPPVNGAPLKVAPVDSSFQVLVVGN